MKKTFLTIGIVGALFATNGYADKQQPILVSYTCPDTCTVTNDEALTKFGCVYSNNNDCGTPVTKILEFIPIPENTIETVSQQTNEKSKPVAARAAKKTTQKPNVGNKPKGSDKAAGGTVLVTCPDGCKFKCRDSGYCWCEDSAGKKCGEEMVSTGSLDK